MARIVIDARESGTSTGRYVDKLLEHMHALKPDHDITVLTKQHRLSYMQQIAPNFTALASPYKEFTFGEQIGLKKQIKSLQPDLVHFAIVQQPVLYRGRAVTTIHDLTTVRFKNPSKNPVIFTAKQQVYKWVIKKAARNSRVILTPTQYVKKDVVAFTGISPDKVIVTLESGDKITDTATKIQRLEGKQFIMYVGRPMPHKNLERLIDTFADMQKSMPDLYLVLAGKKDTLYEGHERYAHEKGIRNILFTGFITEGELRWLYEHTACYVFPSLSEGFGLPGLEAMANGAPVASSNYTCLPELYGDAAEFFDPTDTGGVEKSVMTVITDKKRADELRKLGKTQASKYSWTRMAKQTLEAYDRALS